MSSIPMERALEIALEQHRAGNYKRTEQFYMEILRQDPGNVDAIHLLGVLAHQGKKPEAAVELISAAIRKKADVPTFHYNLAEALNALGKLDEAIAEYKIAADLAPEYFEAWNNLGNTYNASSRFVEGESACRRACEIQPDSAAPWNNLGNSLRGQQRFDEAVDCYQQAIGFLPEFPEAITNLAIAFCSMNRLEEGVAMFRDAIRLRPSNADAHNNLGVALINLGKFDEAGESFQTAVDVKPDHFEAWNNLGATLRTLSRPQESIECFKEALKVKEDLPSALGNLAASLHDVGRNQEALEEIEKSISRKTSAPKEQFLRAGILRDLQRYDDAIDAYRKVLEDDADNPGTVAALSYALMERGDVDEAKQLFDRAIELKPDPQTLSNVMMLVNYHPAYSPAALLEAHKAWGDLHEKPLIADWKPHTNDRDPERKLRIGYVSPDFRGHSVGFFVEPVLEHHNHEHFEIYGYAHLANTDMNTWKLRSKIDQWRELSLILPQKVADQIREDKIDILIELAGHTANNALPVFARKPAPVQVNMIGFPSTTGLSAMDYRVTDELCDPTGISDQFNTETLIRLPDVFWCYQPPVQAPPVIPLPMDTNGFVTFTSVNNMTKITPAVQNLWARILKAVPHSKLIMQSTSLASEQGQNIVKKRFEAAGVSPDRIYFRKSTQLIPYLQLLTDSDMTLDPFPFNGGTTTCHSLWMGAPVVSLAGQTHAGRMGLSMLSCVGLPEFCGNTEDEYLDIAVRFANDPKRLRQIRTGMRERLLASPLLDGAKYVCNLEAAYRRIWRKWCESGV